MKVFWCKVKTPSFGLDAQIPTNEIRFLFCLFYIIYQLLIMFSINIVL